MYEVCISRDKCLLHYIHSHMILHLIKFKESSDLLLQRQICCIKFIHLPILVFFLFPLKKLVPTMVPTIQLPIFVRNIVISKFISLYLRFLQNDEKILLYGISPLLFYNTHVFFYPIYFFFTYRIRICFLYM